MAYNVIVPDSLDFNGDRQFQILKSDWAKVGVDLTEVNGGDSSQAYSLETAASTSRVERSGAIGSTGRFRKARKP